MGSSQKKKIESYAASSPPSEAGEMCPSLRSQISHFSSLPSVACHQSHLISSSRKCERFRQVDEIYMILLDGKTDFLLPLHECRWSIMASQLPGRTDNDIKNYWNTKLKKKLLGITPFQRKPHRRNNHHHQNQHFSPSPSSLSQGAGSESFPITSRVMPRSTPVISSDFFQVPYHRYQMKSSSNMNTVSIDQSCISSEENCTRLSNIKDLNYGYGRGEGQIGILKESKLFLLGGGCQVETGLEYSLEEIKQLLISNSACNNNNHNLYLDHPIANGKMENSKLQHAPDFPLGGITITAVSCSDRQSIWLTTES
ncbi:hypothetical protein C4D60_Mb05t07200 [Musa balbisiana]|uniref:HTH myb-type domain-containing protein n=1 Tax=Musa balbisiana TaxID=52838 RepID=A0A4V4H801_MUSBA|nr:hypothetical protein C4D60_Mb05t07200 [Musa balbisiana]